MKVSQGRLLASIGALVGSRVAMCTYTGRLSTGTALCRARAKREQICAGSPQDHPAFGTCCAITRHFASSITRPWYSRTAATFPCMILCRLRSLVKSVPYMKVLVAAASSYSPPVCRFQNPCAFPEHSSMQNKEMKDPTRFSLVFPPLTLSFGADNHPLCKHVSTRIHRSLEVSISLKARTISSGLPRRREANTNVTASVLYCSGGLQESDVFRRGGRAAMVGRRKQRKARGLARMCVRFYLPPLRTHDRRYTPREMTRLAITEKRSALRSLS